ncbi:MAG: hypothetical protein KJ585_11905, partial [Alphaproteobacteria bacterium]|nr:hypothetical protein [Alphaproteobacteria bacterium]
KINRTASHTENVVSTPGFGAKSTPSNISYLRSRVPCVFRWHCSTWVKLIGSKHPNAVQPYIWAPFILMGR